MSTVVGTPPGVTASGYRAAPPPTLPVTGAVVWFDSSYAPSFTYSSGAVVSQWRDLSGNNRHLSQPTASLQPVRNGTQNGRTTVVFDGADDYMDTAAFTLPQPLTICTAIWERGGDATQGLVSSVGGNLQTYTSSGGGGWRLYAGAEIQTSAGVGAHTYMFTVNGASSAIFIDGASTVTGNAGTSGTTTGLRVASERSATAGYRLNGSLFEVAVYDRILDATERGLIQTYFVTKWGTSP